MKYKLHRTTGGVIASWHAISTLVTIVGLSIATFANADPIDPAKYDHPVKVACMGDSITKGEGTTDPAKLGYPAQLQEMLGAKWEVKNFGVGGRTLLRKQDPYALSPALKWQPDVMIIMLGTNDSRQATWDKHGSEFLDDYKSVIETCKAIPSKPKIYICLPVPSFPGNYGILDEILTSKVIPLIRQAAEEEKVSLLDLHTAMLDHKQEFPDRVHPNVEGAKHIAEAVSKALTEATATAPAN